MGYRVNNVIGVRLAWRDAQGADWYTTHACVSEAREEQAKLPADTADWVIFELVQPGKYATCGQVLDSSDEVGVAS